MAEVEVGGIKFRGGKIFVILTALTTAGGALWGGFEFYKDYLNMKEQIQEYVAPDLSEFDKNIALTKEEMEKSMHRLRLAFIKIDSMLKAMSEGILTPEAEGSHENQDEETPS